MKILTSLTIIGCTLLSCRQSNSSELVTYSNPPAFQACEDIQIDLQGTVNTYAEAIIENWLLRVPRDNPAILHMFADRDKLPSRDLLPWSGEFAGKYLTSLVQMMRLTRDERLKTTGQSFVKQLVALQAEDGYLGPFPKESRLTGSKPNGRRTWDAWGHYHTMLGLMLWHDTVGDPESLECAKRIGDLFCEKFLDTDKQLAATGSTEMNLAVVHSLALLHKRTGEGNYLKLAHEVVKKDFSAPNAGNYLEAGLEGLEFHQIPKPRWESLHPIMGLAELYWIDGSEQYRKAFEHFWWSIVKLDRHNNGGFSSGERAHGDPYHQGPIETCCTVAWMAMSLEMLKMTGDSRVADELEHSTLNQALATYDRSGRWSTYNTPMEGCRIPSTVDIAFQIRPGSEELNCCSVNAARPYGLIADWALMHDADGLVLNWYGPATIRSKVGENLVTITQDTQYPVDGTIKIRIDPEQQDKFTLKLRIPHWSKKTSVEVNGKPISVKAGTYLALEREWQAGDEIVLHLDTSVRFWKGESSYAGKASVYRGPLLMAYGEQFPARLSFSKQWYAFGHFRATDDKQATVELKFNGDSVEWQGFYMPDAGKARVFIDDEEVAVVDQYGPERDVPFSWKHDQLGPGQHTLRLEVQGEKQAESKGTWVNIQKLQPSLDIPTVDAKSVAENSTIEAVELGYLKMNVQTTNGANVQLRDFATVGLDGRSYYTWLPISGAPATPFTRQNPSRTAILSSEQNEP